MSGGRTGRAGFGQPGRNGKPDGGEGAGVGVGGPGGTGTGVGPGGATWSQRMLHQNHVLNDVARHVE